MTEGSADELERAYRGSKVLLTGHTGFKGAWLTVWLTALGAEVTGLALRPPTDPSLFDDLRLASRCDDIEGDVRDIGTVEAAIQRAAPDYVFHLAAQAIVHEGFRRPLETFETNVIGTANVLEAIRRRGRPCAVVIVTSDKCYAVVGEAGPRHEDDPLGGADPYSASKAAAEILTAGLRSSFFPPDRISAHGVAVATARAGNVIGGGDWALDRIVPDAMRALQMRRAIPVRNPGHVRPWQHVLEPLSGYLLLGMRLSGDGGDRYCEAWNFGPPPDEERTVGELTEALIREWGSGTWQAVDGSASHRETPVLRLDIAKACSRLAWRPRWDLATALGHSVEWYRARQDGVRPEGLYALCLRQIEAYTQA